MLWHKCPEHPKCIPSCRFNRHWDFELQHTSKERNHGPDGPLVCLNNPAGFASTEGPSGHTETSDGIPDPRCTASTKNRSYLVRVPKYWGQLIISSRFLLKSWNSEHFQTKTHPYFALKPRQTRDKSALTSIRRNMCALEDLQTGNAVTNDINLLHPFGRQLNFISCLVKYSYHLLPELS